MEPPVTFDADPVRDEKCKVLQAVRPISVEEVGAVAVRGQYGAGSIDGRRVEGYRSEKGVARNSRTETYAALKLQIDNWRWADVPFYLRAGKRLPRRVTEIVIQFKRTPHFLFRSVPREQLAPNLLVLRIQPDEGISLRFRAKVPDPEIKIQPVTMDFRYGSSFGADPPEAYERLLLDAVRGDATLYARADWSEAAWGVVEPLLKAWEKSAPPKFPNYEAGSWGPVEADALVGRDGRSWHLL